MPVSLLVYPYLSFFVIGMVPVVQVTFLQNKVSAMPHPISTDQLKHCLGTRVRVSFFKHSRKMSVLIIGSLLNFGFSKDRSHILLFLLLSVVLRYRCSLKEF